MAIPQHSTASDLYYFVFTVTIIIQRASLLSVMACVYQLLVNVTCMGVDVFIITVSSFTFQDMVGV